MKVLIHWLMVTAVLLLPLMHFAVDAIEASTPTGARDECSDDDLLLIVDTYFNSNAAIKACGQDAVQMFNENPYQYTETPADGPTQCASRCADYVVSAMESASQCTVGGDVVIDYLENLCLWNEFLASESDESGSSGSPPPPTPTISPPMDRAHTLTGAGLAAVIVLTVVSMVTM
ncbi:hypothetical protein Poli38472_001438 [Pythium oligandrum]|uniref:Elicitin-like protein n=1 Tax=Pythium oligandrum TaxID=41045 RepID=A0A8K1CUU5_PYTOL|nr:hypothetical protein Poli38472_001438 [Pythium oligandrum]|eukprot:TMW69282.1 hypothetical protein Poli38472_001438 [Pythium oligandrum]